MNPDKTYQISDTNQDIISRWYGARRLEFYTGDGRGGVVRFSAHTDGKTHLCEWWAEEPKEMPEPFFMFTETTERTMK